MLDYRIRLFKDDFDFHIDNLPESLKVYFGDQYQRAQKILQKRNHIEILYAIDLLDWMLFEGKRLQIIFDESSSNQSKRLYANRVKALKQLKSSHQVDISEPRYFPQANWSDYFAVMSLVYITEILHSYDYLIEHGQLIMETDVPRIMEWAIECMDAICTAELYQYQEMTELNHIENKDVLIRNMDFAQIKSDILCRYSKKFAHTNISNREAAIEIVEDLKKTKHCSGRFPYETIERWIEQYKKGIFKNSCFSFTDQ